MDRSICLAALTQEGGDVETELRRTLGKLLLFAHICRCMIGMCVTPLSEDGMKETILWGIQTTAHTVN